MEDGKMGSDLLTPEEICDKLSEKIRTLYDLPEDIGVFHLKYSENFTYRLESPDHKTKYVLRVNRPEYHPYEELESELTWMRALERDTDIQMASVRPGRDGKFIQDLNFEGESKTYLCSMFSFVEGEGIRDISLERLIPLQKEIGRITAKMHMQVMSWKEGKTLPRFHWDLEDLFGETCRWGDWSLTSHLTKQQRADVEKAVEIGKKRINAYGKTDENYGLIHSDLNINNILVKGSKVKVLDFDDCGYGWFLYDLATAVLEYDDTLDIMIQSWLQGYQTVRKLSKRDLMEVDTFVVLRKIVRMGWIATHSANDTVKRVNQRYYDQTAALAAEYIKKQKESEGVA